MLDICAWFELARVFSAPKADRRNRDERGGGEKNDYSRRCPTQTHRTGLLCSKGKKKRKEKKKRLRVQQRTMDAMDETDALDGEHESHTALLCNDTLGLVFDGVSLQSGRFYVPLRDRWAVALVCRRWHGLVRSASLERPTPKRRRLVARDDDLVRYNGAIRGRLVRATALVSVAKRLAVHEIDSAMHSALHNVGRARLAAVLVASDRVDHVQHAIRLWNDCIHTEDPIEARQWDDLHNDLTRMIENACGNVGNPYCCFIGHQDPATIRLCAMLTVAARHANAPEPLALLLQASTHYLSRESIVRATIAAAALDRPDAFGYMLVAYAQHATSRGKYLHCDASAQADAMAMWLWRTVGACGANRVAQRLLDFSDATERTVGLVLSPQWCSHLSPTEIARRNVALGWFHRVGRWGSNRRGEWLWAAVANDNPAALRVARFGETMALLPDLFCNAARKGKSRFCESILALMGYAEGSGALDMVHSPSFSYSYTPSGIVWLARQPWYSPSSRGVAGDHVRTLYRQAPPLDDMIDALCRLIERCPDVMHFVRRRKFASPILFTCIAHNRWDLFDRYLDCLANVTRNSAVATEQEAFNVWALFDQTVRYNGSTALRLIQHCSACAALPMGVAFDHLLQRCCRPGGSFFERSCNCPFARPCDLCSARPCDAKWWATMCRPIPIPAAHLYFRHTPLPPEEGDPADNFAVLAAFERLSFHGLIADDADV